MLRADGLIQKVPKTNRCQLTDQDRLPVSAIIPVQQTSMSILNRIAPEKS
jgi:hypothetical protein